MVVACTDAVIDEDAVMVQPGDAFLADGAVLAARRLERRAGPACCTGVEEREVIRVLGEVIGDIGRVDSPWVGCHGQVEEYIGKNDRCEKSRLLKKGNEWPGGW